MSLIKTQSQSQLRKSSSTKTTNTIQDSLHKTISFSLDSEYHSQSQQISLNSLITSTNYSLSVLPQQIPNSHPFLFKSETNPKIFKNLSSKEIFTYLYQSNKVQGTENVFESEEILNDLFISNEDKNGRAVKNELNKRLISLPINLDNDEIKNIKGNKKEKDKLSLMITFEPCDKNNLLEFSQNLLEIPIHLKLNGKINEGINSSSSHLINLLNDDYSFSIDVKRIYKSIQYCIENYKIKLISKIMNNKNNNITNNTSTKIISLNYFFVPLIDYHNVSFLIRSSPNLPIYDIANLKTNFNSIVKKNFNLMKIFICLDITKIVNSDNNYQNIPIITNKFHDHSFIGTTKPHLKFSFDINDDTTFLSSNMNNLNTSLKSFIAEDNFRDSYKIFPSNEECIITTRNKVPSSPPEKKSLTLINYNYNNNGINNESLKTDFYNLQQKIYLPFSMNKFEEFHNIIYFDFNDLFTKTLFNRFQDKYNSMCNFMIIEEFLKIEKKNSSRKKITISRFFDSFSEIGCLGLTIPFFLLSGEMKKISLTPSLDSLNLYIKDSFLIKKIQKDFPKLTKIINDNKNNEKENENENILNIEGFIIKLVEKDTIKISYIEKRPYYFTESFDIKISKFLKNFNYISNVNVRKINLEKSYLGISWNSINKDDFHVSFVSYYLFNTDLLGIVTKKEDQNFWTSNIAEIDNRNFIKIDYTYLLIKSSEQVYVFINKNLSDF